MWLAFAVVGTIVAALAVVIAVGVDAALKVLDWDNSW